MTRTRVTSLAGLAGLGFVLGWGLETILLSRSAPLVVPPLVAAITAVVVAVVVVAAAWPIRRSVRGSGTRVDPFHATRVVAFAKASALVGALFSGAMLGILVFLLTRAVVLPALLVPAVAGLVGSVLLLVGGLVAESFCLLPPDDEDPAAAGGR